VVVNPDPTTTAAASSPDPATVGTSVTFTATVTDTITAPIGSVTFYDGAQIPADALPGSPVALTGTMASLSISSLIQGTHNITACYAPPLDPSGTYDFVATCSAPVVQSVVSAPSPAVGTVTVLNSSINPSILGQPVTFSTTVATTGAFVSVPNGTVTLYDGSAVLATQPPSPLTLDATGSAAASTSNLAIGTHPITAVYAGNTAYAPSTSQILSQVVTSSLIPAGNGFLLQVNPSTISVGVGNIATVSVNVAALNNFNQTVQLTCGGLPNESTCSFAQSLIPVGGGTTTLTVSTAAPHACGTGGPYFVASSGFDGTLLGVSALGLFFLRKRKRVFQGLALALALCILPMLNGCSSGCTDFGTQPNTYTFTVTATAGGAVAPSTTPQVSTQTVQMIVHL
jgi:hypothetical protein